MTITERFADFAETLSFDQLPGEFIEKAKLLILDTLGICLGSSRMEFGRQALALASEWQSAHGCHLIGRSQRVAAHHAALINGISGHG